MKVLIKGGRVIEPRTEMDEVQDILIIDKQIKKISKDIRLTPEEEKETKIIKAMDKWVLPGFVDVHVHLREPGFEYKETIATGTKSAAKGGFTTICPMPNTHPVIDSEMMMIAFNKRVEEDALVNVAPIGAITKNLQGEELAEIGFMKKRGIVGISDDGKTVTNSSLMKKAMTYSKMFDLPVMCHCEDEVLAGSGAMHSGKQSTLLGLKGIPSESEEIIVARDLLLAKSTGAKVHICHVSTKGSVEMIRVAKEQGIKVTAEACPHHFTLTDEDITDYDTNTKMNPPLRSKSDREVIRKAIKEGIIEVIATDHAPHAEVDKKRSYDEAPFGIIGLETALPLVMTELVETELLTPRDMVERMSVNPAKLIGLERKLETGQIADIVMVDPHKEHIIDKDNMVSKSKNTPFHGFKVKGSVQMCMVSGKVVYEQ